MNIDNTGTTQATMIGNYTGWLGLGLCATNAMCSFNINWMSFGYPARCAVHGRQDRGVLRARSGTSTRRLAGGLDSWAMGCDMTGGSSGGPWVYGFGRFGAGHSRGATRSTGSSATTTGDTLTRGAERAELARVQLQGDSIYNAINGTAIACP